MKKPDLKKANMSTKTICDLLGVSKWAFHKWVARGLLAPPGGGQGTTWQHSTLTVIEGALIRTLSEKRIALDVIKEAMEHLRGQSPREKGISRLEHLLTQDNAHMMIHLDDEGKAPWLYTMGWDNNEKWTPFDFDAWKNYTTPKDGATVIVTNIKRVAEMVMKKVT